MSIQYHVYVNDGLGGPVDYSAPIGTTATLAFTPPPLASPSDNTFALRAFDAITGFEDQNVDARVRVVIDADGQDITGFPNAPGSVAATAGPAGTAVVSWIYNPGGQGGAPDQFRVYLGTPTPDYSSPAAVEGYGDPREPYSASVSGLADQVVYQVAVRAVNSAGEEQNQVVATVTGQATGPLAVDSFTATVVP